MKTYESKKRNNSYWAVSAIATLCLASSCSAEGVSSSNSLTETTTPVIDSVVEASEKATPITAPETTTTTSTDPQTNVTEVSVELLPALERDFELVMTNEEFVEMLQSLERFSFEGSDQIATSVPIIPGTRFFLKNGLEVIRPYVSLDGETLNARDFTRTEENPEGTNMFDLPTYKFEEHGVDPDLVQYWFLDINGDVRKFTTSDIFGHESTFLPDGFAENGWFFDRDYVQIVIIGENGLLKDGEDKFDLKKTRIGSATSWVIELDNTCLFVGTAIEAGQDWHKRTGCE